MGFFSRIITFFGLVLLAHAGYSAHEHTTLYSNVALAASTASTTPTTATNFFAVVPLDITIETLIAVILVSAGLVSGAEKLKPVTHSAWAGQIEREGGAKNPYKNLEIRSGFWDVRKSRQEFADWMRTQGQER
ncbi:hypothetical protein TCE0_042f14696 [Talaromyces pinophilus]|uniref:Magnesium transporter n=1 Tax=Talaromyces pinophilus TaxID=128442 RepID=A0A6V8HIA5_TALPI|nr:hypothetical protein DPV78_009712 [Talaromyces pinophilus]PCG91659.1 Magnesium transporter [Penicillium occitanis (nom. inval.)]PCH02849.1 hypothetical protein PENOC_041330 [Penicillium occitanis (nom. inval.)]GAM41517.1 hypothetical protein TCE0_042f14696 [Talaromyces pinophilus]